MPALLDSTPVSLAYDQCLTNLEEDEAMVKSQLTPIRCEQCGWQIQTKTRPVVAYSGSLVKMTPHFYHPTCWRKESK